MNGTISEEEGSFSSKVLTHPGQIAVTLTFFSSYPKFIAKLSVKLIKAALLAAYAILEKDPFKPSVLTTLTITAFGFKDDFSPTLKAKGAVTFTAITLSHVSKS